MRSSTAGIFSSVILISLAVGLVIGYFYFWGIIFLAMGIASLVSGIWLRIKNKKLKMAKDWKL